MLSPLVPGQIWEAGSQLKMMPGVWLPTRMTVIQLAPGRLALHSPIPIDEALAAEIAALGEVAVLIAPNNYHHLALPKAAKRYPQAELWGSPGLLKKRQDVSFTGVLDANARPAWADILVPYFLRGAPAMDETVFLHRPSKTLIVVDSLFNMKTARNSISRFMLRITSAYGRAAQSPVWRFTVKDRAAMAESTRPLLALDFERIVVSHGEVVTENAREVLRSASQWLYA